MGRPKKYLREDKLESARRLFNERGFSATSIGDLVERLGINRKSLYAEFGDKQALFELALSHHMQNNFVRVVGPLEAHDAGVDEIRGALEWWGSQARSPGAGVGCLVCNTASERSAHDAGSRRFVRIYMKRLSGGFRNALHNARERGDLVDTLDIDAEAAFLTSHGIGQLTLVRSKVAPAIVESAARVAIERLASLSKA